MKGAGRYDIIQNRTHSCYHKFLPALTDLYQYHFEADSIAYNTRKNSSLKTVEKLVREYLPDLNEEMVCRLSVAIKESL